MNVPSKRWMRRVAMHHSVLMAVVTVGIFSLYVTRPYPDVITRASFATGYVALALLALTLWIGPWNVLRGRRTPISQDLRRDVGMWTGIVGLVHTAIGLDVHLRGRPWLYFVYRKSEGPHWIPLRHDLFGFANYTGLVGSIVLLLLFATSNDYALRALTTPRWKQLQRWNYVLFAMVILHTAAYQKIEKPYLSHIATLVICAAITLLLQGFGFWTRRSRTIRAPQKMGAGSI